MTEGFAFLPEALESNAAGRLTDAQRKMFTRVRWLRRWLSVFTGDLRRGEVKAIEGAIHKPAPESSGSGTPGVWWYFLEVAGKRFEVPSKSVWESAPGAGWFRLYYLPRSHTAVNLERLPDPAVDTAQPLVDPLQEVMTSVIRPAFTVRGRTKKAESMARADAALRAAMGATNPPGNAPTGTPSPTAVAGRWTGPLFDVDVRSDGSLTMTNPAQGGSQSGRWRIGPEGRLHVRFDGDADELVTDFTVDGDVLSIDLGGQRVALRRATA